MSEGDKKKVKLAPGQSLPHVALIYSDSDTHSNESKHLSRYLAAHLVATGYAHVYLVGHRHDGMPCDLPSMARTRTLYLPVNQSKAAEIPSSDIKYEHWSFLQSGRVHVIIICVNANDTESCRDKLSELVRSSTAAGERPNVVIFSMQRGVRSGSILKDGLSNMKGVAFVECAVGFAVVPHPGNGSYCATVTRPRLVMERLSKEVEQAALGPAQLIESMGFEVFYRKTLTPMAWGTLVWECIYALNALTGGTMAQMLSKRRYRLILASMIRECSIALKAAARGGKWEIDFSLITGSTGILSHSIVELFLTLPDILYAPLAYIFGLSTCLTPALISPITLDIDEGRESMISHHFKELLSSGERFKVKMPVCTAVYETISSIEPKKGQPKLRMDAQERIKRAADATFIDADTGKNKTHASFQELLFWVVRIVAVLSVLYLLYHLIFED